MPSAKKDSSPVACDPESHAEHVLTLDRRKPNSERRSGDPDATDIGMMSTPRRKKQRRRHIDPTTCERDYSDPEIEFMRAMDDYKRKSGRMFPTCSEVLEVVRDLGYVRLTDDQRDILGLDDEVELDDVSNESVADEFEEEEHSEEF
ncbi:MAG: hypothetical protein AAFU85_12085 [Planctomycetota bacterium]